jgi:histidinol dehydrogenase
MLRTLDLRGTGREALATLPRPDLGAEGPVNDVRAIIAQVRAEGDRALIDFTKRFDGVELDSLGVPKAALDEALARIPSELRAALVAAHDAIEDFHRHRMTERETYRRDGITITDLDLPVARAGVYVPGGRAIYPSSVLMTAVPARVAGVGAVVACVPPGPNGELPDEILAAARIAGVDEVYRVGGAQAIAAMAYGTESIEKVDVIVGPGNKWVSIAQREVRGAVGVPSAFAGPSEVVVIADETTPPDWAAIDVIVQAEHGPDGLAWLITWSEEAAETINAAIGRLVGASPRGEETARTLEHGGYVVVVDGPEQAFAVANTIAPEHLEIMAADPESLLKYVTNAGAIFLGPYSPASVGDYIAGPSHVLPTFGTARYASVLGVEDFCRRVHAVRVSKEAIEILGPHVEAISASEGLPAHGESVRLRRDRATWSKR